MPTQASGSKRSCAGRDVPSKQIPPQGQMPLQGLMSQQGHSLPPGQMSSQGQMPSQEQMHQGQIQPQRQMRLQGPQGQSPPWQVSAERNATSHTARPTYEYGTRTISPCFRYHNHTDSTSSNRLRWANSQDTLRQGQRPGPSWLAPSQQIPNQNYAIPPQQQQPPPGWMRQSMPPGYPSGLQSHQPPNARHSLMAPKHSS